MDKHKRFEKLYFKYIVKSSKVFLVYIGVFVALLIGMTTGIKLKDYQKYEAMISGNQITIEHKESKEASELEMYSNEKIYAYVDKNQEVFTFTVKKMIFEQGIITFFLNENQEKLSGKILIEIPSHERTLLQTIINMNGSKNE